MGAVNPLNLYTSFLLDKSKLLRVQAHVTGVLRLHSVRQQIFQTALTARHGDALVVAEENEAIVARKVKNCFVDCRPPAPFSPLRHIQLDCLV